MFAELWDITFGAFKGLAIILIGSCMTLAIFFAFGCVIAAILSLWEN